MKINYEVKPNISPIIENVKEVLSNWLGDDEFSYHYFLRGLNIKHLMKHMIMKNW